MKSQPLFALAAILLFQPATAGDTLVQISTIDALMKGIYDGGCTFETLKKHGDFGIGTLDDLDGEMLALDGQFFQITSDGVVHNIDDKAETPFSAVTFFNSEKSARLEKSDSLTDLQTQLDAASASPNLFHAIRITGQFSMMSLRSVPKQTPPYVTLPEAAKHQTLFKLENVRGTLVGFRCPPFVKGINVPGYHFHFISEDRKSGGHVLDCAVTAATVDLDVLENLKVLLPQDEAFLKADFTTHDAKALESVEKSAPAK
ncbi:MAG TPA: acetolactate decarboxylase [Luteolibacter sp.]